ncbi:hypothetical protein HanRHA438_Chr16g0761061 [Helianthus annuus]|uniref:Uncharacterized protein n=1 Tax=Helianthus annuus TaxID=4232 RepID=A0A9K3DR47_HELAN|nr:uncharacterized protein LOC110918251 isoform X2 [Helianthus annuus]KAF5760095.1 hypothetical protein HanXRQr2_Chr16g0749261 [Helianthus annuus]KAJ0438196.1 hypothetical protein HanHA300_Chr16g0611171 [Helianthus annuus]KAJ0460522.1 hypothetical protein HanHA89_Chr16g0661771 [Helianthus annuus]KAJ0640954.1 hypothetical protein HanLR1_Chr16g0621601 [Helianthus annuus]KAJ0644873.1 hypothetical protein HanOQP8_Chr16g0617281 [Helianthus annuus]
MEIPHIGGHLDPFRPSRTVDKVSDCVRSQRKIPTVSDFYVPFVPISDSRLTKTKDQDKIEVLMVSSPNHYDMVFPKAEYKSVKKAAIVFFFSITIPFGIALGIALSKTYKENSPSSLIIVGLLNASSVGLLYLHGSGRFQIKSYATVLQGNDINVNEHNEPIASLERIREEEIPRDTNPLAIVADNNPRVASPTRGGGGMSLVSTDRISDVSSVQRVKKEEVESKILAWQNSKIAKINNCNT